MAQCHSLINSKGKLKSQKLANLAHSVPASLKDAVKFQTDEEAQKINYSVVALSDLQPGVNQGGILSCKVVNFVPKQTPVPTCFLCCDSKCNFFVVSVYNANKQFLEKLKYGDSVLVKNPNLIYTSCEYKQKLFTFPTVKVSVVKDLLVNG